MYIPLLSELVGVGRDWLKGKQAIKQAEQENTARLLADKESNNSAWEMANLQDKDKFLRWFSFVMFSSPFWIAIVSPEQVRDYFEVAINSVPVWWQQMFIAINGGVWGISSLKNVVPALIQGIKKAAKKD